MANFDIGTYKIIQTGMNDGYGWIMVYNSGSGTVNRARLNFVTSGVGTVRESGSIVSVDMHVSSFERVIDTLRNEKPVTFVWFPSWAGVYTGEEPVGEGEAGDPG